MKFDVDIIATYWPIILQGFGLTVVISLGAFCVALFMGGLIALMKLASFPPLRWIAQIYIELFRNVPFLIQIFLAYYMLPFYGLRLPAITVGILTLGLYVGAYFAEIVRGAIQSVPRGQLDSAMAVGMSRAQTMRYVIAPQMLGVLIPPLTSQTLSMVKETSLLSSITVKELTMSGLVVQGNTFSPIETFTMVAGLYWAYTAALSVLARWLERALQPYRRERPKAQAGFFKRAMAPAAAR